MRQRLTERELQKIVRRIVKEGVVPDFTPEEFAQQYPSFKGTVTVQNGTVYANVNGTNVIIQSAA